MCIKEYQIADLVIIWITDTENPLFRWICQIVFQPGQISLITSTASSFVFLLATVTCATMILELCRKFKAMALLKYMTTGTC